VEFQQRGPALTHLFRHRAEHGDTPGKSKGRLLRPLLNVSTLVEFGQRIALPAGIPLGRLINPAHIEINKAAPETEAASFKNKRALLV